MSLLSAWSISLDSTFKCLMANYCTRLHGICKGLSHDGGREDFSKNLRETPINKDLLHEPNFGQSPRFKQEEK
jgi:hypothetical protein